MKSSLFLLIFMLCISSTGYTWSPVPLNDEMLAVAVDKGLESVLQDSSLYSGDHLIVEKGGSDLDRFLAERCMQQLFQKGCDVYTETDSVQDGTLFSLKPVNMHIRYDVNKTPGYQNGYVHRVVYAEFNIKMIDRGSGKLLYINDVNGTADDWIPVALLDYVEQGSILVKPERPSGGPMKRWVEPLLVIGAAGAISILFYTIRSQ